MTEQFKQLGVWMDWEHPYQTIKLDYLESAWWTIQKAEEKKLLKASSRVVTWCPRCETALAEAEIEYWDETDPSIMVRFPLKSGDGSLLIWTTTPWTLAANMAVAVHPDFDYAKVRMKGASGEETVYVLESQAEYVMQKGGYESFEVLERMKGKDMEGMEYLPPFENENVPKSEWTFRVVTADYVEKDNTGLVHTAPGHGPDDYETGKRYGISPFCPVAENGRYTDEFPLMAGKKVKTVADEVIKILDEKGLMYNKSKIKHRYGHCWRCKSPIIYRNTRQWFITVPDIKDEMLAEIDRVKWVPDWAGSTRERNWVEGARDWCISRQRYWGIPMPVRRATGTPREWTRTGPGSTASRSSAPSAARPCTGSQTSWTSGSTPVSPPGPTWATPGGRTSSASGGPRGSSWRPTTRPADGSTPSWEPESYPSTAPPTTRS